MNKWQEFLYIIRRLNRSRADLELDEEIRAHLDNEIQDNIKNGMSLLEARQAALRAFGSVALSKERSRKMWGFSSFDKLGQDLKYGFRMLRKSPSFSAVAVITLALGIGANTAIFSLVYGVMLKPFPYRQSDRIVKISNYHRGGSGDELNATGSAVMDWRRDTKSFEQIVFSYVTTGIAKLGDQSKRITTCVILPETFSFLGQQPLLGRTFTKEEGDRGEMLTILSYGFWHEQFGSDPNIINKTLAIDNKVYTVIGVMPPTFSFPDDHPRILWIPASESDLLGNPSIPIFNAYGRLEPGVSLKQAQAEMDTIADNQEKADPADYKDLAIKVSPLDDTVLGNYRPALRLLLGAVSFLLLIACTNIANLFLSRNATRQKEFAIRAALGAGRFRLIRQMLTECLIVALIGGAAGLLLAYWVLGSLVALLSAELPRLVEVRIDWHVLVYTLTATLLTGLLCGLGPAWQSRKTDLGQSIQEAARGLMNRNHHRLRNSLVIAEVGLSLVLLIGAGLMINSLVRLAHLDRGFNSENVLAMELEMPFSKFQRSQQRTNVIHQVIDRIAAIPGIETVCSVTGYPGSVGKEVGIGSINLVGNNQQTQSDRLRAIVRATSTEYFRVLKLPLLSGRFFSDQDTANSRKVTIINQKLAEELWPDVNPIGQQFVFPQDLRVSSESGVPFEIVGIVGNMKEHPSDAISPEIYVPYEQSHIFEMGLLVRTSNNPTSFIKIIRDQIRAFDSDLAVANVATMEHNLAAQSSSRRVYGFMITGFAGLALLLAVVGLYGVLSNLVNQRTQEIGIRMALGAEANNILKMVISQGLILVFSGIVIGIGGSIALTRFLKSMLFGVSVTDPITFIGISTLLVFVALLACFIPARRAARVDPMIALRYE